MGFVSFKTKENSRKCTDCRFNIANFNFESFDVTVSDKGYLNFIGVDENIKNIAETARKVAIKSALGVMWAACKVCPVRPDFIKVYGIEPIEHYKPLNPDIEIPAKEAL
ncbi:MAG: hypothetical protein WDA74_10445 [Spirochaetota bacterium]